MKVPVKLTVFAAAMTVAFAAAYGVGSVLDPIAAEDTVDLATADGSGDEDHGDTDLGDEPSADDEAGEAPVAEPAVPVPAAGVVLAGLAVSDRGYTLRLVDPTPGAGDAVTVEFTIESPDGGPVLNYRIAHEEEMHLIVARRDLTGFQHLHPERDAAGTWSVLVDLSDAGVYRVFADFLPAAQSETLTLGADVFVPGQFSPADLPAASESWSGDDGYEVQLTGMPGAGTESELGFTVTRDGDRVEDLEPYLGAFGHLVALRAGDLAYLHTHPAEEATAGQPGGPEIRFGTTFPTAGQYRLYLNFAHEGVVRTAEFTVDVPAGAPPAPAAAPTASPPAQTPSTEPEADSGGHSGH